MKIVAHDFSRLVDGDLECWDPRGASPAEVRAVANELRARRDEEFGRRNRLIAALDACALEAIRAAFAKAHAERFAHANQCRQADARDAGALTNNGLVVVPCSHGAASHFGCDACAGEEEEARKRGEVGIGKTTDGEVF